MANTLYINYHDLAPKYIVILYNMKLKGLLDVWYVSFSKFRFFSCTIHLQLMIKVSKCA